MNGEILCVGTELLLGDVINTNAAFAARGLAEIGIGVYRQAVVGDNPGRLKAALQEALNRADLVILTGGLGPTYDDLTKETTAEFFGREMEMHLPSLEKIRGYFAKTRRQMTLNNEKQAMMPKGAVVFPNHYGTAPGLALEDEEKGKIAVLLPGPPSEMEPMFTEEVLPYLRKKTGVGALVSRTVHIFGMGESAVEEQLRELMIASKNPTLAPYAKEGEVQLRITARADTPEQAAALAAPMVEKVLNKVGEVVYGVDVGTLQNAVVQELKRQGWKAAVAESCTGGLLAKRITEIPGSSQVFDCGIVSYANEVKAGVLGVSRETLERYGAVSSQTAMEMAKGVRKLAGAQFGVSTTGIAGPDGGTAEKPVGLVYVGLDWEGHSEAVELRLSRGRNREREKIRYLASSHGLALLLKAIRQAAGDLERE